MNPTTVATWVIVLYIMAERFVRLSLPKIAAFN
jgi:hypothetical protein